MRDAPRRGQSDLDRLRPRLVAVARAQLGPLAMAQAGPAAVYALAVWDVVNALAAHYDAAGDDILNKAEFPMLKTALARRGELMRQSCDLLEDKA